MESQEECYDKAKPSTNTSYGLRSISPSLIKEDALRTSSPLSYPVEEQPSKEQDSISSMELKRGGFNDRAKRQAKDAVGGDFFKSSVDEFLKKSNEMKEEFRKLEFLCKELSPKRKAEKSFEPEDRYKELETLSMPQSMEWRPLNDILIKIGLRPLASVHGGAVDPSEVTIAFQHIVRECEATHQSLREANSEITRLVTEQNALISDRNKLRTDLRHSKEDARRETEGKLKHLEAEVADLRVKLTQAEHKESVARRLKEPSGDRGKEVFRACMGRDFVPQSSKDTKIMGIILMYEDHLRALEGDIQKLSQREHELYTQLRESSTLFSRDRPRQEAGLSKRLAEILEVEGTNEGIIRGVITLLKVVRVVPSLENLLKQVCEIVLPSPQSIHELIPALTKLVQEAKTVGAIRESLTRLQPTLDFEQYLATTLMADLRGLTVYRLLFKVEARDSVEASVQQVFLYVHEVSQFFREVRRGLHLHPETEMQGVLDHLARQLVIK
jgi:flagellar motility protein MotE (MotC chaperone)